ncbi:MAG: hypothetical protein ACKVOJ_12455 [Sphingomonadaceae bacterium]
MSWQKLRGVFATWGWVLLAVMGLMLAGLGLGIALYRGIANPWAALSFSFAQAVLSAGVVTGVIRAAQQAGFFKDQLREVIYSDSLHGSLIDANRAWQSLTRGLFRQRFASLSDQNLDSLSVEALIGSAEYYYESHWRQIDIEWEDEGVGTLKIIETVSAVVRTADLGRDVSFANVYEPEAEDSLRRSIDYSLSDGKAFSRHFTETDVKQRADSKEELVVRLPPASAIKLTRKTVKFQKLKSDPFLNFRSTSLLVNPEIVVTTPKNSQLRFYFRPMGLLSPFVARDGTDIDGELTALNAQCTTLCLPNQGYMIVITGIM